MSTTLNRAPVTVAELVAALRDQRQAIAHEPERAVPGEPEPQTVSALVVLGAHPGAGASSVAVAIADAAARNTAEDPREPVRLVDAASQGASGLICAADRELGVDAAGWRVGARGVVEVHRPSGNLVSPVEIPTLAPFEAGRLVVDAGWPIRDLLARPNAVGALLKDASLVVVCRATVPGVRRAELALADFPGHPLVVGVGARRWPGSVLATFGPLLRGAHEGGRVGLLPADRRLAIEGVDNSPLPRATAAAATRLLHLAWPPTRTVPAKRTREYL